MRILQIGGNGIVGVAHPGPVSRVVGELANELASLGHQVTVADSRANGPRSGLRHDVRMVELDLDCRLPITLRRTRAERWKNRWRNSRYDRVFAGALMASIDPAEFDVIHTHMPLAPLGRALAAACPGKHVHTCHTAIWADSDRYAGPRGRYRRVRLELGKRLRRNELGFMRHTALNVGLGGFLGDALDRLSPDTLSRIPFEIIPNGIHPALWDPFDRESARGKLGVGGTDFLVVMVGRLDPIKGHRCLIDAVRAVAGQIPGLRVLMIGRAESEKYRRELLARSADLPVEWLGHRPRDALIALMSAADASLVTSEFDTQPTVVMESLALGLPVVATRVGAVPEMVSADVGFLVERGDSGAIAEKLLRLARDPKLRSDLGNAGRRRIEARFSWHLTAQRYVRAYRDHLLREEQNKAGGQCAISESSRISSVDSARL